MNFWTLILFERRMNQVSQSTKVIKKPVAVANHWFAQSEFIRNVPTEKSAANF